MTDPSFLTREEIRRRLPADKVRPVRILQMLLMLTSSVFALAVMLLYLMGSAQDALVPRDADFAAVSLLAKILGVAVVLTVACLAVLPVWLLNPRMLRHRIRRAAGTDSFETLLSLFHTLILTRMLVVCTLASYGAVVALVAAVNKTLHVQPTLWLTLAPWMFCLAYGLATLPTRRKLVDFMVVQAFEPLRGIETGSAPARAGGLALRYPQAGDAVQHAEFSLGLGTLSLWLPGVLLSAGALTVLFARDNWQAFIVLGLLASGFILGGWFVQRNVPFSLTVHQKGVVFNCRTWSGFFPFRELSGVHNSTFGIRLRAGVRRRVLLPGSKAKLVASLIRKQQGFKD